MTDKQWDKRILDFLKRTGDEIKSETQRLVGEVRDPSTQQKVKESLREFGSWVKQTAEDAAEMMERAIKKAETALSDKAAASSPGARVEGGAESAKAAPSPDASAGAAPPRQSQKTVGKSKRASGKKPRTRAPSKTIGRKS